jgi:GTPase SAR1 family protein
VVGEQSAGKSSLLKSLTGIPFPVKSGIGTHFPIRIVSRRTAQGSSERFHIDVEKAPNDVEGLEHADQKAENYVLKGDTLTMSMFEAALQDVSYLTPSFIRQHSLSITLSFLRITLESEKVADNRRRISWQILSELIFRGLTDHSSTFWTFLDSSIQA